MIDCFLDGLTWTAKLWEMGDEAIRRQNSASPDDYLFRKW